MLDFPLNPVNGQFFAASTGVTYQYQTPPGVWNDSGSPGFETGPPFVGDTPPGNPSAGSMWWNSTLGQLFIYYKDADSAQWVPATPVPTGTGPLDVKISFGAKGDGVTDDKAAFQAAFTALGSGAGTLYVPTGTYMISGPVGATLSSDLEIVMATDAVIKATASFPAGYKLWQFLAPDTPSLNYRLKISGGKLDGSLRPAVLPGTAADLLNIGGSGFVQCTIDGVFFYSNADRTGIAGDSGVFFASGRNVTISNCIFQGTTDTAIYLSGDTTQSFGDNATFYNNTYRECYGAIASKRQWKRMTVWGEDIEGTITAISTAEADTAPTKLPGLDITVAWCNIRSCSRGIDVRWSDGAKVMHNKITDFGVSYVTGPITPSTDSGILIEGSSNCLIDGNTCTIAGYTTIGGQSGIRLSPRTIDAVTRNSTNNLIVNNQVNAVTRGIAEDDANQDFNRYLNNVVVGAAVNASYIVNGVNSTHDRGLENNRRELNYPTVSLGGIQGAEALRAIRTTSGVNWWQVQGSATGGVANFNVTGLDADISALISARGLGAIIFGAPLGTESMRINKIASQVNRLQVQGAIAGSSPLINVAGTDTNIGILLTPKGTGAVTITLANVGNYTTDALAAAGGVPIGGIYRNASALQIRVT